MFFLFRNCDFNLDCTDCISGRTICSGGIRPCDTPFECGFDSDVSGVDVATSQEECKEVFPYLFSD